MTDEVKRPHGAPRIRKRLTKEERQTDAEAQHIKTLKGYLQQRAEPDAFSSMYSSGMDKGRLPIEPPYNFNALVRLVDENFMLGQCIDAMQTNVFGHDYKWEPVNGSDGQSAEAKKERETLQQLFDNPNGEKSWDDIKAALGRDYETTRNAYLEIGRDQKGRVVMFSHITSTSMRLTNRDHDPVEVTIPLTRDGSIINVKVRRRFRRYVQLAGTKKIYFKEFGDPRRIDPATGEENQNLSIEDSATEVFHFTAYNPRSPYGSPRWIAQLPSVLGSRQSELTNLDFFNDNGIPAMAVLVSGGMLTSESLDDIQDTIAGVRGRRSMNRVVVLEVQGDNKAAADNGAIPPPRVEIKPLAGERQKDGLFLEYLKECAHNIRSSFRLPPVFVGALVQEMTYASAKVSFEVAESQVFYPERRKFDEMVNTVILASWAPKHWRYKSMPAKISDGSEIVTAIEKFNDAGALTPNITIGLANEYFALQIPEIKDPWGNWPFELIKLYAAKGTLKGLGDVVEAMDPIAQPATADTPEEKTKERVQQVQRFVQALDKLDDLSLAA